MQRFFRSIPYLVLAILGSAPFAVYAQTAKTEANEPPAARIALYRLAPGKQLDFLKWAAETDAIAKEAGVPASQTYVHTNGDAWDYMQIVPILTSAQQAKVDEVTKKRGRKTGVQASLEFRTFVAWHTDTDTMGPLTAAEIVAMASK